MVRAYPQRKEGNHGGIAPTIITDLGLLYSSQLRSPSTKIE